MGDAPCQRSARGGANRGRVQRHSSPDEQNDEPKMQRADIANEMFVEGTINGDPTSTRRGKSVIEGPRRQQGPETDLQVL